MKVLILGLGMQGSFLVRDIAESDRVSTVIVGDSDLQRLKKQGKFMSGKVETAHIDVRNQRKLMMLMEDIDVVINSTDWRYNHIVTDTAIKACVNMIDMGTIFDDILKKQLELHEVAKDADLTIIPCCGLSPGITNLLTWHGVSKLDRVDEIHIRCGGIPQKPKPPLGYKIVWSFKGVIDEYTEMVKILKNGKPKYVPPLTGIEMIEFPHPPGVYECFYTQGLSTLPDTIEGVREMDYKTVRHLGHCQKMRTLVELGFTRTDPINLNNYEVKPRDLLIKLLQPVLELGCDRDMVLLRVSIIGERKGVRTNVVFQMFDFFDETRSVTAMSRTTIYPCSIIAKMLMKGDIKEKGVLPPEKAVPIKQFMSELGKRNIYINQTVHKLT